MRLQDSLVVWIALAASAGAGAALQGQADVVARDAWVRAAPSVKMNTAAFMVLENRSVRAAEVVSARSTAARVVEIHETRDDNGIMRMRKVDRLSIPPHGSVTLKPGGLHLMLLDLPAPLGPGATVTFTLMFADGSAIDVVATVKPLS